MLLFLMMLVISMTASYDANGKYIGPKSACRICGHPFKVKRGSRVNHINNKKPCPGRFEQTVYTDEDPDMYGDPT